jgi:phage terminase large subunit-like protein
MDENAWQKANPNLGVSIGVKAIRDEFVKAKDRPAEINKFKTKHMNVWTQAEEVWITDEKWMACGSEVDLARVASRPCWAGLDLSVNTDISAFVAAFAKDEAGVSALIPMFFIPSEAMIERERRDKVPYSMWVEQGYVIATPGGYIDYNYVMQYITEFARQYQLEEVAYDPAYAAQVSIDLANRGVNMVEFRQGSLTMSPAILEFEKKVLAVELAHGGNPVLRWMMQCTTVKQNESGLRRLVKPDRNKSTKRIDGSIAGVMAVARLVQNTEFGSVYEDRGIITI